MFVSDIPKSLFLIIQSKSGTSIKIYGSEIEIFSAFLRS